MLSPSVAVVHAVVHAVRIHFYAVGTLINTWIKSCVTWSSSHIVMSHDMEQLTADHSFVHSSV